MIGDHESPIQQIRALIKDAESRGAKDAKCGNASNFSGFELHTAIFHLTIANYLLRLNEPMAAIQSVLVSRELCHKYHLHSILNTAELFLAEIRYKLDDFSTVKIPPLIAN